MNLEKKCHYQQCLKIINKKAHWILKNINSDNDT